MAIRDTRFIIKNNQTPNAPFSGATLLKGEAIVNTADGIMMFSGVTSSTSEWTPAGPGLNSSFFEVGSNLYDLQIRNKITKYQGQSGVNLSGKFLSGTTDGFVLGDILDIYNPSLDTYVTGSTLTSANDNDNNQTSQLSYHGNAIGGPFNIVTENTYTTGGTYDNNTAFITFDRNNGTNFTVDLSSLDLNDTYVTGGTNNPATNNTPNSSISLIYNQDVAPLTYELPYTNVYITGFTYNNNKFELKDNSGNTLSQIINVVTGLTINGDLTVTGYTSLQNTNINDLTGNTINLPNLNSNRVVYTTNSGQLTTESNFTYDENTDILGVNNIEVSNDVTIQGNLKVFGQAISAFTNELYVEDPNITLNFNPTGNTTVTSVNSGFVIQDGNGLNGGDVNWDIVRMQNLTGLTSTEIPNISEYTSGNGYSNRGWISQLNDIVIRSIDPIDNNISGSINGVRVIAEFDILDGGQY